MILYTPTCQGHGAECPDWEYCDDDHGTVSYCDNTCAGARDLYQADILARRAPAPVPTVDSITLEMAEANSHNPARWVVTFEGPDAEAWALAYIEARWTTHVVYELPDAPFSMAAYPLLADKLYPMCEHGMSADLCEGPDHYMTRDQEMARGW